MNCIKINGVLFKIDFEKTYDKVKQDILQQALRIKGFTLIWYNWVQDFV